MIEKNFHPSIIQRTTASLSPSSGSLLHTYIHTNLPHDIAHLFSGLYLQLNQKAEALSILIALTFSRTTKGNLQNKVWE
jgi:hypothetical protein